MLHMSQQILHLVSEIINVIVKIIVMFSTTNTADGYFDPTAHFVNLLSNGQGKHYMSANNNAYYVAIDSDNNVQALPESQIPNVSCTHHMV